MKTENTARLYNVEFLRIWFILIIFTGHIVRPFPDYELSLFGLRLNGFHSGVDFFFVVGGFFLYRRAVSDTPAFEQIKKIWLRLIPGMLFAFAICVAFFKFRIAQLPSVLLLTGGTGLTVPPMRFADWFFGAYFWISCFYISVFKWPRKVAFPVLGMVIFITACLLVHEPPTNPRNQFFMEAYHSVLGSHFCQGLFCMGVGMAAGFLSERVELPQRPAGRFIGTAAEIGCLIALFKCSAWSDHNHQTSPEFVATMALFLICCAHRWGYITAAMNAARGVQYVSRYVFPSLIGHIIIMRLFFINDFFGMTPGWRLCANLAGSVLIGLVEYHLIERALVPWLVRYFRTGADTSPRP